MNEQYLAHLERTLRAFVRLVDKLELAESVGNTDRSLWREELKEARAALIEARRIALEGFENGEA